MSHVISFSFDPTVSSSFPCDETERERKDEDQEEGKRDHFLFCVWEKEGKKEKRRR